MPCGGRIRTGQKRVGEGQGSKKGKIRPRRIRKKRRKASYWSGCDDLEVVRKVKKNRGAGAAWTAGEGPDMFEKRIRIPKGDLWARENACKGKRGRAIETQV